MLLADDTRARTAFRLLLFAWMALIFFLSSRSRLPRLGDMSPELVSVAGHFTVYAVLATLFWAVLPSTGWSTRRRLAVAFAGTVAFGVSDEWHQSFVAGREPAVFDLAVNTLAALCALAALTLGMRAWESRAAQQPGTGAPHRG